MKTDWSINGIPGIFADKTYDVYTDKQRLVDLCMDFLDNNPIEGKVRWCLYIHGFPGCGKTHFACNALKAFVIKNRQRSAQFFTCKSYFALIQEQFGDNIANSNMDRKLKDLDLIVLDDIGVTRGTDWQREKIYDLIEERYNSGKKTIMSSNITLYENGQGKAPFFDDRLYRRISEGKVVMMEKSPHQGEGNAYKREEKKLFEPSKSEKLNRMPYNEN